MSLYIGNEMNRMNLRTMFNFPIEHNHSDLILKKKNEKNNIQNIIDQLLTIQLFS